MRNNNNKYSFEFINNQFVNRNYKLLENKYINNETKMKYICNKHNEHIQEIAYRDFQTGRGCKYCGKETSIKKRLKTTDKFICEVKLIDKLSHIDIIGEYMGANKKILCHCNKHNIDFYANPTTLKNGQKGCKLCSKESTHILKTKTNEQFLEEVYNKNKNIEVVGMYTEAKNKIRVKCLLDGYEWDVTAQSLISVGNDPCPVCRSRVVIQGINDIITTLPHVTKWVKNFEQAKTLSAGTAKNIDLKCPDCGYEFSKKCYDVKRGISCRRCGDGVSYPEKVIHNLLCSLGIENVTQATFHWSKNKRYDFHLIKENFLIELQGLQHYEKGFEWIGGRTLEEEIENDLIKSQLAKENNIKLIVIDARYSDIDYLKNSILNSKLSSIYDLSNVDWNNIFTISLHSNICKAAELYNQGIDRFEIAKILGVSECTVRQTYLPKATKLGLCNYIKRNVNKSNILKECLI